MLLKLDQIQENVTEIRATQQLMSQPNTSVSDITEVLEEPCKTVEELEELCDRLKDADYRRKIVCPITLATLG